MSDYRRLIAYLHEYRQGERRESVGFVKLHARDGECRIWIRMGDNCFPGKTVCRAYLFTKKRERLMGHFLGEMESRGGTLEWKETVRTDDLQGDGLNLEESRGLYIEGEGRIFAADWNNVPVDVAQFVSPEQSARQEPEETESSEPDVLLAAEVGQDFPEPEESAEEEPAEELSEELTEASAEVPAVESEEELKGEGADAFEEEQMEVPGEKAGESAGEALWKQWEYLESRFPVKRYAEGNGAVTACVQLTVRDLNRIPGNPWSLGNNSFLLHGLYQYRHILLMQRRTNDRVCCQIAVPGIYNEREQRMASMFGFQEFKVMKASDGRAGKFGYWCRTLAENV